MRVAAIKWGRDDKRNYGTLRAKCDVSLDRYDALRDKIEGFIDQAKQQDVRLVVLPAFVGNIYQQLDSSSQEYTDLIKQHSVCYDVCICSGSYWLEEDSGMYQVADIFYQGELILRQKQLHLSRWERAVGLERGVEQNYAVFNGWKIGIVMGTDVFYPQVSRSLALKGVNLVCSPVGFVGEFNSCLQVSGMWNQTQQNQFFAIESGFNGSLYGRRFWAEAAIHAPLDMTKREDGFLAKATQDEMLVTADVNRDERRKVISHYGVLAQINTGFCTNTSTKDNL